MIEEAGRQIQRERGIEQPSGDFGLELVAGFKKGSFEANIAITRGLQFARVAAEKIIHAVNWLERMPEKPSAKEPDLAIQVVKHVNRIGKIQKSDKTEMRFELKNGRKKAEAIFTQAGISATESLRAPHFEMEGVSLYGKLYELRDSKPEQEEEGRFFWGELYRDNGELWRVRFGNADIDKVTGLFRKQVLITGKAVYYRAQTPKVVVDEITQDVERDYESAFDELYGCNKKVYDADLKTLLKEIRGDA